MRLAILASRFCGIPRSARPTPISLMYDVYRQASDHIRTPPSSRPLWSGFGSADCGRQNPPNPEVLRTPHMTSGEVFSAKGAKIPMVARSPN